MESLEDRTLLANFVVDTTNDTVDAVPGDGIAEDASGDTSLRAAIMEANALGGADTITIPAGTFTLSIAGTFENAALTGDLDVTGNVVITGAGAGSTTIDGAGIDRVFDLISGSLELHNLTITGGTAIGTNMDILEDRGGAVRADFLTTLTITGSRFTGNTAPRTTGGNFGIGGAIESAGAVTIVASTFTNNSASNSGGAISTEGGGSTLDIDDSTFEDNTAPSGGALSNGSTTTIDGSTFFNNGNGLGPASFGNGGAIENKGAGDLTLTNSTLSGNTSQIGGGILNLGTLSLLNSTITDNTASSGGGIDSAVSGTVTIENTIVAENTATTSSPDVDGTVTSSGHNLIGDTTGSVGFGAMGDLLNVAALLRPLDNYGGPTRTHLPFSNSPAINAGNTATAPAIDQRGLSRPHGPAADIGAVELALSFLVNTTADTVDANPGDGVAEDAGGNTSLRAAIMEANALVGPDVIRLPAGTYTLSLAGTLEDGAATGDLDILDDLTLMGIGVTQPIIDANQIDRVLHVHPGSSSSNPVQLTLENLTITGGEALGSSTNLIQDRGAGLFMDFFTEVTIDEVLFINNSAPRTGTSTVHGLGGAIANHGHLTVLDSRFENNTATNSGGAIYTSGSNPTAVIMRSTFANNVARDGGAMESRGTTTIDDSLFVGNNSGGSFGAGGALNIQTGVVTLTNSTLSGNDSAFGGGIINTSSGTLIINSSTITDNSASFGGGVRSSGSVTIENTIIAGNTVSNSNPDVEGTVTSSGHNLIGDTTGSSGFGAVGDLLNLNPMLEPLADNGGPTLTHALMPASPAVNAGNTATAPSADQRGTSRPQGPASDIGAFELIGPQFLVVDTLSDVSDGDFSAGNYSLREALQHANVAPTDDVISFDAALSGGTITLSGTALPITDTVTINGPGQVQLTIDGNNLSRIFEITGTLTDVTIDGLTLTRGQGVDFGGAINASSIGELTITNSTISNSVTTGTFGHGAGLYATSTDVILTDVTFVGNNASGDGGGVYVQGVSSFATITTSTFTNNSAPGNNGGAIANRANMSIVESTITNNSARQGGAILNALAMTITRSTVTENTGMFGGALYMFKGNAMGPSDLTIVETTISGNEATSSAGALSLGGDTIIIRDSTISGNTAESHAGAIENGPHTTDIRSVLILNSTISGNSAGRLGGGISNGNVLAVRNSTVVGNRSNSDGTDTWPGGGIYSSNNSSTSTLLHNSLVAGNVSGNGAGTPDDLGKIRNGMVIGLDVDPASSHNLISDAATSGGLTDGVDGNIVGNSGAGTIALATILNPTLAANGGPTETHALVAGSPAIDAGDDAQAVDENAAPLAHDQRQAPFVRIADGNGDMTATVDMGAFELDLSPQTFVVDTISDVSDGDFSAGNFSLREAIEQSNAFPTDDTIQFDAALSGMTIVLGGTDLLITDDVTINGLGAAQLTISGGSLSRIFQIDGVTNGPINVSIDGLTLTGGVATGTFPASTGGAIYNNRGILTLSNLVVTGNSAGFSGGGVSSSLGVVTITDSEFTLNTATSVGGAIANGNSDFTLTDVVLDDNDAGSGGAIYNSGTSSQPAFMDLLRVSITNNTSTGLGGGGLYNSLEAVTTMTDSLVDGNQANGSGGGILTLNNSDMTITNSVISNNTAGSQGGGIQHSSSVMLLESSTVSNNVAGGDGGGIRSSGPPAAPLMTIRSSTIFGNSSSDDGGGISTGQGAVEIINSTISGNTAADVGGGIEILGTNSFAMQILSTTIVGNRADSDGNASGTGGGIYFYDSSPPSYPLLHNTIVAGNVTGAVAADVPDDITSANNISVYSASSHNLIGNAATAGGLTDGVDGNIVGNGGVGTIPLNTILEPTLADNGGPTQTHALVAGSLAIDAADPTDFPSSDQRGIARPQGAVADIGAFESDAPLALPLIGIDFGGGTLPTNWTQVNGTTLDFTLFNLIDETGATTAVDAVIDFDDMPTGYINFAPPPSELPTHTQSLAGLDESYVDNDGRIIVTFQDLTPGQVYEIYVFGGDTLADTQRVTITGSSVTQFSYTHGANELYVNRTVGSSSMPLETFAELMAADGSGMIQVQVDNTGGTWFGLAGLALRKSDQATELSVSIDMASISENGGMATGTVTRNGSTGDLVVDLSSDDPGEASVPATVTILDGMTSATFPVTGVDDLIVDGTQPVTVTASAAGLSDGMDSLDVTDDDVAPVTLIVDTFVDESDGDFSMGDLSLREAIELANISIGHDTILFDPLLTGATITLGGTELLITDDVTITGLGSGQLTIDADGLSRVFFVDGVSTGPIDVEIVGLSLTGGEAIGQLPTQEGGGLFNDGGNVTLTDISATGNHARFGGAFASTNGTLSVIDSTVSGNNADVWGGGFSNLQADIFLTRVILDNNSAPNGGVMTANGTVSDRANVTLLDTQVTNNSVTGFGGAFDFSARVTFLATNSLFTGNEATGVNVAGGVLSALMDSDITFVNSLIHDNLTDGAGGGLLIIQSTLRLENSTVSDNDANGNVGGGIAFSDTNPSATTGMTIIGSTISGNTTGTSGGGLFAQGGVHTIINSTISGNTAAGVGGGFEDFGATILVRSSTITGNRADSDGNSSSAGGGIYLTNDATNSTTSLHNTIVAGNVSGMNGADLPDDVNTGTGASLVAGSSHNLIGDAATAGGLTHGMNGNIVGNSGAGTIPIGTILDTMLADNGGPTLTHALVGGSLAIDNGDTAEAVDENSNPLLTDQRLFGRIAGTSVDIGAVEFDSVPVYLPTIVEAVINGGSANRSGIAEIVLMFSEAVTIASVSSLKLFNHTTGMSVSLSGATLVNNGTTDITLDLTELDAPLPNGRYTLELPKNETTPSLYATTSTGFWKQSGDIDGDGSVNFNDTVPISLNFGVTGAAPYSDGDGDGDGNVNFNDTVPLSLNFGTSLTALTYDFGDATETDTFYPTTLANNGARHVITGNTLLLGVDRDAETDGQPSGDATGDGADEDGVDISPFVIRGTTVGVTVTSTGVGFLNAWVDFNQDGDWNDPGEQVFIDEPVVAAMNNLEMTIPLEALLGDTFARFRLTGTAGYSHFGLAPDGEVEDYVVTISQVVEGLTVDPDPGDADLAASVAETGPIDADPEQVSAGTIHITTTDDPPQDRSSDRRQDRLKRILSPEFTTFDHPTSQFSILSRGRGRGR